jgi:NAD(P)-dependent dehydrogenase (short-subunit alcohol dehydrogenase family)
MENAAYSISKGMVVHLGDLINAYGKRKGIRATVIIPSTIDTPDNRKAMPESDFTRWVKAGDIGETIAFLLSEPGKAMREGVIKIYNEA